MNIVERLLYFSDTQNTEYLDIQNCTNIENLNVIAIELVSWLKLQHKRELWIQQGRRASLKPMPLNTNYPWCNELIDYLKQDNELSRHFVIVDNNLDIKPIMSDEEIRQLRKFAYDNYNPEIFI